MSIRFVGCGSTVCSRPSSTISSGTRSWRSISASGGPRHRAARRIVFGDNPVAFVAQSDEAQHHPRRFSADPFERINFWRGGGRQIARRRQLLLFR